MVITQPLNAFLKPDYSDAFDGGWEKVCSSSWSSASDDKSRERETCIDAQKGLPEVAKRNVKPIHDWHKGRLNSQAQINGLFSEPRKSVYVHACSLMHNTRYRKRGEEENEGMITFSEEGKL